MSKLSKAEIGNLGSSPPPASSPAESAANVGVEELEGLSQEGAHLAGPHQEERHPEDGVEDGNDPAPVGLRSDVAISLKYI